MKPYYQDERCTIYCADNREVLPFLIGDTESTYVCVTDPPYAVNTAALAWDRWQVAVWGMLYQLVREYLVFSMAPHVAHLRVPDVLAAGWQVLEVGAWVYGNGRAVNDSRLKRSYDSVYFLSKSSRSLFANNARGYYRAGTITGKSTSNSVTRTPGKFGRTFGIIQSSSTYEYRQDYHPANVACSTGCLAFGDTRYDLIFSVKRVRSQGYTHPTEKPLELICQQIKLVSNSEDDIIVDPFMGRGTTAVACQNINRRFVGIERDEKYVEMAAKRIEDNQLKLDSMLLKPWEDTAKKKSVQYSMF